MRFLLLFIEKSWANFNQQNGILKLISHVWVLDGVTFKVEALEKELNELIFEADHLHKNIPNFDSQEGFLNSQIEVCAWCKWTLSQQKEWKKNWNLVSMTCKWNSIIPEKQRRWLKIWFFQGEKFCSSYLPSFQELDVRYEELSKKLESLHKQSSFQIESLSLPKTESANILRKLTLQQNLIITEELKRKQMMEHLASKVIALEAEIDAISEETKQMKNRKSDIEDSFTNILKETEFLCRIEYLLFFILLDMEKLNQCEAYCASLTEQLKPVEPILLSENMVE